MDDDKYALVEKIVKEIHNVLSKNTELCSFDIVPVETNNQNKSPVLHLENCLGLESWCVKHVYMYCYSELMDKYFCKVKPVKVSSVISDRLIQLLNVMLLLNPELSTFWNKRREIFLKFLLERSTEFRFTKLVLLRKPKCNDAFTYRRWLLEAVLEDETLSSDYTANLLNEELQICNITADKSPNNYHSWSHRMWLLNKLKSTRKQFNLNLLFQKEYSFSERWTSKHVSDFSCFHYRQYCIKNIFTLNDESWYVLENSMDTNLRQNFVRMLANNFPKDVIVQVPQDLVSYSEDSLINFILCHAVKNCDCLINNVLVCRKLQILFHELNLNNDLLRFYKYHETLWYHRRFVVHEILVIMYEQFGLVRQNGALVKKVCSECSLDDLIQKHAKISRYDSNRVFSSILFKVMLRHEKNFIMERRSDGDNYADRHEKYLKFIEGLHEAVA